MKIDQTIQASKLLPGLERFWELSGEKIRRIESEYDTAQGSPVFTINGKYTTRGWTEWTQGFQYGSAILQFDATGEQAFLDSGRRDTVEKMAPHVSHIGVHDHGFNNVSTYGSLLRLCREGRIDAAPTETDFYELALKVSGAVQAARWTRIPDGGYIYSFNGPHSLFVDTIRSVRVLMIGHALGHSLMGEQDQAISLLGRACDHLRATAKYSVFYGEGRDQYDAWGRTAHESVFNTNDGAFRCPNSQQGYSGFSTWTRGLAWAMLGFSEQLEFVANLGTDELIPMGGKEELQSLLLRAARATCDFYIHNTSADGIPFWDTGAPHLHRLGNITSQDADPFNDHEPVDSSAAAIGCQGLMRFGAYLRSHDEEEVGVMYLQAGLTVFERLLRDPYLSDNPEHQGLVLHSIYHRPNGWDHVPDGRKVPCGESSMWGDYHMREAALYVQRMAEGKPHLTFFGCL
jgi:hypothetical protein